jgi:hypothetical protein
MSPSRLEKRGVSRPSRHARRGCGGRVVLQRDLTPTNNIDAHGQVVWSWHPGADAKFLEMRSARLATTGARKPVPGESAKQLLKPLRREGRYWAEPVVLPRAFCCTRTAGISRYPVFPAPSLLRRVNDPNNSDASAPRERSSSPFVQCALVAGCHGERRCRH